MYENNFSGINSPDTENKESNMEVKASEVVFGSQTSIETNSSAYGGSNNAATGAYSSSNNIDSNAYNSSYSSNNSADGNAYSGSYSSSNNTDSSAYGSSYSSNNNVGNVSYGSSYNNSSNLNRNSYSSTGVNTSANTGANTYNAAASGIPANAGSIGNSSNLGTSNPTNSYGYGSGTWNNSNYRQTADSYQYSNSYLNSADNVKKEKKKKEKKKKEGTGFFKKALVCVALGLFFGVCAGLGFYAVETATGMLDNNSSTQSYAIGESANADATANTKNSEDVVSNSVNNETDGSSTLKPQNITTVVSDVSDVVSAVMPAVVSISNTYTERMSYFGQTLTSEAEASGSGIIVGKNDTELLIATNYHVIEDADKLKVQFVENSEVEASVKGTDPDMDLAVISVSLDSIQKSTLDQIVIATLGDSDALTVGEPAIAIGNSLGYGQSVTTGVISALNRDMELSDGSTGTFIQTDAAINPGNSGGALLNIKGEVIGINSNKIGGSVIEGMGYAIPISAASPIIAELMLKETKNKVAEDERGFLGISGISVTSEVSSAYGMPEGVYIAQVYDGTAASAAGLVKGDIITEFDGESVSSMEELQTILEYYAKGDTVEMTVMTVGNGGYHSRTVSITLGNKVG